MDSGTLSIHPWMPGVDKTWTLQGSHESENKSSWNISILYHITIRNPVVRRERLGHWELRGVYISTKHGGSKAHDGIFYPLKRRIKECHNVGKRMPKLPFGDGFHRKK